MNAPAMLRIDSSAGKLAPLAARPLRTVPLADLPDLRALLAANPESLFQQVGLPLRFLAASIPVRSDLTPPMLAIDAGGRVYVVALQTGDRPPELAPALEAASTVAEWSSADFRRVVDKGEFDALGRFLKTPLERLNHGQGIVLIAERATPEGVAVIEWLRQSYSLHLITLGLRRWIDPESGQQYLAVDPAPRTADAGAEAPLQLLSLPAATPSLPAEPQPEAAAPVVAPVDAKPPSPIAPEPQAPDAAAAEFDAAPVLKAPPPAEPAAVPPPAVPQTPAAPESSAPAPAAEERETRAAPSFDALLSQEARDFQGGADEDPLAELLADIEKARQMPSALSEPTPTQAAESAERRRASRGADYQARRLRLDYLNRPLGARVVDFSSVGIGVEALSPLPVGAEVRITGEIVGGEGAVALEGLARVAHCSARPDGVCRIGFALEPENIRKSTAEAQDFDRR